MGHFLLDTNAFTVLYDPRTAERAPRFHSAVWGRVSRDMEVAIPSFVLYESRRGLEELQLRNEGQGRIAAFDRVVSTATILSLDFNDNEGWFKAANLWARDRLKGTNLGEGDLLVAATALLYERKLVTADQPLIRAMRALGLDGILDAHRWE